MSLSILFSSSFLFSLAAILILAGAIFAYVTMRINEQDHKLNSMLGLVSTVAAETQYFRAKIASLQNHLSADDCDTVEGIILKTNPNDETELISVSDGEVSEDDEDSEDEDDIEEDDEEEEDSDEEGDDNDDDEGDEDINGSPALNLSSNEFTLENIEDLEPNSATIKTVHLDLNETLTAPFNLENEVSHFLENNDKDIDVNIVLNTNTVETDDAREYKKMPLQKLKEIAVAKGLVADASKLKKHDLLKIIEN
jgi:hypothetical protein